MAAAAGPGANVVVDKPSRLGDHGRQPKAAPERYHECHRFVRGCKSWGVDSAPGRLLETVRVPSLVSLLGKAEEQYGRELFVAQGVKCDGA